MSPSNERGINLAIVVSHPIQHFVSFYRAVAAQPGVNLKVFFGSRIGLENYFDTEMNQEIKWAMNLLDGYQSEFLPEAERVRSATALAFNNPSIWSALNKFEPDAVVLYGYSHVTPLWAISWCKVHSVPALMIADSELRRPRSFLVSSFKKIALQTVFSQFSGFLTVGDNNEDYFQYYGVPGSRLFRSPFTIDEVSFREARKNRTALRSAFRLEHGIGDKEFVALFVGKLGERKRPADLLAAAAVAHNTNGVSIRCLLAGGGRQAEALKEQARRDGIDATFLGFLNVDLLPEAYCAADVLVHPSAADPHPLVCSEAACIGLPMVLSDRVGAEGPTDVARSGVNAEVYPCGDVSALADILTTLALNPRRREAMSVASTAIFDTLDVQCSVGGMMAALGTIIKHSRGDEMRPLQRAPSGAAS